MIKSRSKPQIPASNLIVSGGQLDYQHPFKLNIVSIDDAQKMGSVSVNRNSHILKSDSILDTLPIVGKDIAVELPYGHKIWIEVLFDSSRVPVMGFVKAGPKWTATTLDSQGSPQEVYPEGVEMISRTDLAAKTLEVDFLISYVSTVQSLSNDELQYRLNNGLLTQEDYSSLLSLSAEQFDSYRSILREYKADLPTFFSAAPSQQWKKLFRLYKLIGYSTKDESRALQANKLYFPNEGSSTTPAVPQSTEKADYRIAQCLHTDLQVVSSWHLDIYPSKALIPCGRPVHSFFIDGESEEEINANS
jgi:hypothetical protein